MVLALPRVALRMVETPVNGFLLDYAVSWQAELELSSSGAQRRRDLVAEGVRKGQGLLPHGMEPVLLACALCFVRPTVDGRDMECWVSSVRGQSPARDPATMTHPY